MEHLAQHATTLRTGGERGVSNGLNGVEIMGALGANVGVRGHELAPLTAEEGRSPAGTRSGECQSYGTGAVSSLLSKQRHRRAYRGDVNGRDLATTGLVAVGGAAGALARYGADLIWPWEAPQFPWATLSVNVLGCALIGAFLVWTLEGPTTSWWLRPLVAVGVIGGFTTFSAFAVEALLMTDDGAVGQASLYVGISVVAGLIAVWMSATLTRRLIRVDGS